MVENEDAGISRRDVIRRGLVTGGALVWAAPVVQSVSRVAYAGTPGPEPTPSSTPTNPSPDPTPSPTPPTGECVWYAINVQRPTAEHGWLCHDVPNPGDFDCYVDGSPGLEAARPGGCEYWFGVQGFTDGTEWLILDAAVSAPSIQGYLKCETGGCQSPVETFDWNDQHVLKFAGCPGGGQLERGVVNYQAVFCAHSG
jgi:hypothetical protein